MRSDTKISGKNFDVIVIGGGAAGMSAALWCDELGMKTLLIEKESRLGGQLARVYNPIENHLGVKAADGKELRRIFVRQIKPRGFEKSLQTEVIAVDLQSKTVTARGGAKFSARALIIATGVSRRKLNVAGEDEFTDKGILESGKRDAKKVSGKIVGIVGGGDAALENALILSETAAKVYLIHRRKNFRARREFIDKVKNNPKIEILTDTIVTKIGGKKNIESVEMQNLKTKESKTLAVDALLFRLGVQPNTELFAKDLRLDKNGYIKTDRHAATNIKNIFAVGDVANPLAPTISTAVGTGASAAKSLFSELRKIKANLQKNVF